ncbi:MAG: DM13 domain-containing protein [Marmoricola sp.]
MVKWVVGVVGAAVLAAALLWFEPWRAFTSSEIDEAAPTSPSRSAAPPPVAGPVDVAATPAPPAVDRVLATGRFVDAEHSTSGTAKILELADGRRFLRLEGLSTSDGPDVHVWLSDRSAGGSWGKYDDGEYVRLGRLKATDGNQNYRIPADADLGPVRSAVIWCDRFDVAFGAAPLRVG